MKLHFKFPIKESLINHKWYRLTLPSSIKSTLRLLPSWVPDFSTILKAWLQLIELERNSVSSLCLFIGLEELCLKRDAPPILITFGPTEFTDTFLWFKDFRFWYVSLPSMDYEHHKRWNISLTNWRQRDHFLINPFFHGIIIEIGRRKKLLALVQGVFNPVNGL